MSDQLKFRLALSYDGAGFHGWAKQPGLRTVQGVLEDALNRLLRSEHPVQLAVAGRTDVGVHAAGQVAHFAVPEDLLISFCGSSQASKMADASAMDAPAADAPGAAQFASLLQRRLSRMLSADPDVVVHDITPVDPAFDARFSALWRSYEYRIADALSLKNPLERHRTVQHTKMLDVQLMNLAANSLLGLQDFATFCKPRPESTTIRTLLDFSWQRAESDGVLTATLRADAFCHSMVRALVGACVAVGEGRLSIPELTALQKASTRTSSFKVMPAHGLTLLAVGYPDPSQFSDQAERTRARRTL